MSCYFRHLGDIFAQAGIQVTKENKKELDQVLHRLVDVEYKNCSQAWRAIKGLKADEALRRKLVEDLKARWNT
jgi:ribosomal protein L17